MTTSFDLAGCRRHRNAARKYDILRLGVTSRWLAGTAAVTSDLSVRIAHVDITARRRRRHVHRRVVRVLDTPTASIYISSFYASATGRLRLAAGSLLIMFYVAAKSQILYYSDDQFNIVRLWSPHAWTRDAHRQYTIQYIILFPGKVMHTLLSRFCCVLYNIKENTACESYVATIPKSLLTRIGLAQSNQFWRNSGKRKQLSKDQKVRMPVSSSYAPPATLKCRDF